MNSNISKWLKRIFSVNTIALLVSICAAYFAYLQYEQSKPGRLECYVHKDYRDYDIKGIKLLYLLTEDYDDLEDLPVIKFENTGKNVISNFKVEITIRGTGGRINKKYDIVEENKNDKTIELIYKKDYLEGKNTLPFPVDEIFETDNGRGYVDIEYHIYYDGLEKPIFFEYIIFFADDIDEEFLRNAYQEIYRLTVLTDEDYDVGNENVGVIFEDTLMTNPINCQSFNLSSGKERENLFNIGESIIMNDNEENDDENNIFFKVKEYLFDLFN